MRGLLSYRFRSPVKSSRLANLKVMKHAAIGAILLLCAAYLGDYAAARSRPLGSVQVRPYYAIRQKSGRIEFDYSPPPEMQNCVASLLPHLGDNPCWYLTKHPTRKIEI